MHDDEPKTARDRANRRWRGMYRVHKAALRQPYNDKRSFYVVDGLLKQDVPVELPDNVIDIEYYRD